MAAAAREEAESGKRGMRHGGATGGEMGAAVLPGGGEPARPHPVAFPRDTEINRNLKLDSGKRKVHLPGAGSILAEEPRGAQVQPKGGLQDMPIR